MKRLLLLLLLTSLCTIAHGASEKPNTVLIHPGEVIYARFTQKGIKLTLVSATKEKDDNAQVILTLPRLDPASTVPFALKIENKFAQYLHYKAEMRLVSKNQRRPLKVYPVVAGKMALETLPPMIEELALYRGESPSAGTDRQSACRPQGKTRGSDLDERRHQAKGTGKMALLYAQDRLPGQVARLQRTRNRTAPFPR